MKRCISCRTKNSENAQQCKNCGCSIFDGYFSNPKTTLKNSHQSPKTTFKISHQTIIVITTIVILILSGIYYLPPMYEKYKIDMAYKAKIQIVEDNLPLIQNFIKTVNCIKKNILSVESNITDAQQINFFTDSLTVAGEQVNFSKNTLIIHEDAIKNLSSIPAKYTSDFIFSQKYKYSSLPDFHNWNGIFNYIYRTDTSKDIKYHIPNELVHDINILKFIKYILVIKEILFLEPEVNGSSMKGGIYECEAMLVNKKNCNLLASFRFKGVNSSTINYKVSRYLPKFFYSKENCVKNNLYSNTIKSFKKLQIEKIFNEKLNLYTNAIITSDETPPLITILEPNLSRRIKRKLKEKFIFIKGIAKDESGIDKISINEKEIDFFDNGKFETKIALKNGENNISIKAIDKRGNSVEETITIIRELNIEKRLALVIGNSTYKDARLKNPVNDANDIGAKLEKLDFKVMKFLNCNEITMKKAIEEFGIKLKDYNIALFFYAGHGVQVSGNNYLVPVDAKLENENEVEYECVRADRVLSKMENAGSTTNIVILDACRDNPFERSWRRGLKGSGLAFMNAPSGSLIAYATSPGNTAFDGSGRNGLYTSALLNFINTPNIKIEEVFKKVRKTIIEESKGKQTPWESTSLIGDLYLKKQ